MEDAGRTKAGSKSLAGVVEDTLALYRRSAGRLSCRFQANFAVHGNLAECDQGPSSPFLLRSPIPFCAVPVHAQPERVVFPLRLPGGRRLSRDARLATLSMKKPGVKSLC